MKRWKPLPIVKPKWDHTSLFRVQPAVVVEKRDAIDAVTGDAEDWRARDLEVRSVLNGYGKVLRMGDKWLASERESPWDLRGVEVQMHEAERWTARRLDREGFVLARVEGSSPLRAVGRLPCRSR